MMNNNNRYCPFSGQWIECQSSASNPVSNMINIVGDTSLQQPPQSQAVR